MRQLKLTQFQITYRGPRLYWLTLPDELWVTIFAMAGIKEACHNVLPRVCHKFNELLLSPALWRDVTISPKVVRKQSLYSTHEFLNVMPWLAKRLLALHTVEIADFMTCGSSELAVALLQDVLVRLAEAPQLTALTMQPTCRGKYNVYGLIAIARLTQLTTLHLEGMASAVRAPVFESLCTLPALRSLRLGFSRKDERFGGPPSLKAVPFARMSPGLTSLQLMGERIQRVHEAAAQLVFRLGDISAELGRLMALEVLELVNCGVTSLPDAIGNLTALTRLAVLTAPDPARSEIALPLPPEVELPPTLSQLTRLQSLGLSSHWLPEEVGCLQSLREIRLSHLGQPRTVADLEEAEMEGFGYASVEGLMDQLTVLRRLSQLSSLWLHDGGPFITLALDALGECSALRKLRMENLSCSDEEGPSLQEACFLSQLELCSMVNLELERVPDYVANMTAVTRLDFRLNDEMCLAADTLISEESGQPTNCMFCDTTNLQVLQLGWQTARTLKPLTVQALSAIQTTLCREDGSCGSILLGIESEVEEDKDPHAAYMTTVAGVDYY